MKLNWWALTASAVNLALAVWCYNIEAYIASSIAAFASGVGLSQALFTPIIDDLLKSLDESIKAIKEFDRSFQELKRGIDNGQN